MGFIKRASLFINNKKTFYRVYLILIVSFVVITGVILFIVQFNTNAIISRLSIDQIQRANGSLSNYLRDFQYKALERAEIIAGNEFIVRSLRVGDYETLIRNLENLGEGMDFVTICDPDGIVLARSHSNAVGDDLSGDSTIAEVARTGKTEGKISNIPTLGIVIIASAAIYDGEALIGSIACGFDLEKTEYVDEFKRQNGCEVSIFYGDVRISTTVTDVQGRRITGGKPDKEIVESVIGHKTDFTGRLESADSVYRAYYSPIIHNDQAIGMLFTGINIDATIKQQRDMQYLIILIALIAIGIAGIFLTVMSRYNRMFASTLEELSDKTESLNVFGNVLDAVSIFIYVTDPETDQILFTNKALMDHLKLENSVIGEYCWKVFQVGMEKRCDYCSLNHLVETGDEIVSWEAYNTITGRYYRNIDRLVDWPDGRKVHFCQRIDITEIKEAQDIMMRTSSIVQSSPNFISSRRLTGECTFVNGAASAITGYSHEELLVSDYMNLIFDEETANYIKNEIYPAVLENGVQRYQVAAQTKDGQIRTLSACTFLIEADEKSFGTIASDITEKKQLEENMQAAFEKAEQANRAKSDFLSRMSHEMYTPMNAIIGMAKLAQKSGEQTEIQNYLKRINSSSEHLLGIISDILDASKIEAGKLKIVEAVYNLEALLNQAISAVELRLQEKKQDRGFTVYVDKDIPKTVVTDGPKLVQVITNLLSNAGKFTQAGGVISLRVHKTLEDCDTCGLLIEVEDNGIGISAEQQQRLFNAFEQADNTITRQYGGTGLGLSISKSIINLMGGEIWVESELGRGSLFSCTVRVGKVVGDEYSAPEFVPLDDKSNTDVLAGKQVLVADDVEINREILVAMLKDLDVGVDCAENGLEAYNKFAADPERYHMIFMDIHMPEMNGYEATGKIRELDTPKAHVVPIIAVTADVFNQDIEKCISAGMNDHIGKPLDMDIVIAKMKRHLS